MARSMMSTRSGFHWTSDEISPSLGAAKVKALLYMDKITKFHGQAAVRYARLNAPWNDITGNAREGLDVSTRSNPAAGNWQIELYHKMNYGIWLEIRWAGRYAIIVPTIEHEAPLYFESAADILNAMFPGGKL